MGGEWVSSERIWNNSQKFIVRHTPHTPLLYEGTDSNSDFPSIVCSVAHYGERVSFQLVVVIYAWQLIHNDNGSIRQALIVWQVQVLPLISPDSNQLYYTILNSAPKYVLYHAANPLYLEATHWDDLPNQARTNFLDLHDSSLNFHKTTQQSCAMALFGTNLDAIQSACEYLMIFQPAAKVLRALFTLSCTGCDVYMCDFHCEQRWEHWTVTAKHGVSNVKDQVLTQLRRIAHAPTAAAYADAVEHFTSSAPWNNHKRLQQWFEKKWLTQHKVGALLCRFVIRHACNWTWKFMFCWLCITSR